MMLSSWKMWAAGGLLALMGQTAAASTVTYGFGNITGGDTVGDALAPNFSLGVSDAGSGQVVFTISSADVPNNTDPYFIGSVFFEDQGVNDLLTGAPSTSLVSVAPVYTLFETKNGENLPQGANLDPKFATDFAYTRATGGKVNGGNAAGVQQGESVSFLFNGSYDDVLAGLNGGTIRIGLHVQAIGSGSDSFVSLPPSAVPLPAAGFLLMAGLGGLGLVRRRKVR